MDISSTHTFRLGLKGSRMGTPVGSKSDALRVTTVRPCSRAVTAIMRSALACRNIRPISAMFFPVIGFVSTRLSTGGAWRLAHGLRVRRGGPFLCPPVPRRVRSSDQGTEPLLAGQRADTRRVRPYATPRALIYPMAFCELSRRDPRTLGVSLHKVQSKFRISKMVRFSLNFDRLGALAIIQPQP